MNQNLFLSQKDRKQKESPLIYEKAEPVTALKAKRDEDGFIAPWVMFRPLSDRGLFREFLGENASSRASDLWLNWDLLQREAYEHEIELLMCRIRLGEIQIQQKFAREDRAAEMFRQGEIRHLPIATSKDTRKTWLDAITWKYDFVQQYKKRCFQFADAVLRYTTLNEDVHGGNEVIERFIAMANKMPEVNRFLLDQMYEAAWYVICMFKYDMKPADIPAPWYDKVGGAKE